MKCWRCGKEIEDGVSRCIYCQTDQNRPEPVSDVGSALRLLYDRYGAEAVLTNPALLANGLGDVIPDTLSVNVKKLKNMLKMVMDAGIGRLYLERMAEGDPDEAFDSRIKTILTEDTGLNEQTADELTGWFDEMIGWKGPGFRCPAFEKKDAVDINYEDGLSLFSLGYMKEMGYGTSRSDDEALTYYEQAAKKGSAAAHFFLGLKYEYGRGIEKSVPDAIHHYREAAALGHGIAVNKIKELDNAASASEIAVVANETEKTAEPLLLRSELITAGIVRFGSCPQNSIDTVDDIEWLVLTIEKDRALLLSKYGLDLRRYHFENRIITWENCDLRAWLNGEFYDTVFSSSEKTKIHMVSNSNNYNPQYRTSGGSKTMDKVFLLSIDEVIRYLPTDESRQCLASRFIRNKKSWIDDGYGHSSWWLRSPGYYSSFAAEVYGSGCISVSGIDVCTDRMVRPALWMAL